MQRTKKKQESSYQATIPMKGFYGVNGEEYSSLSDSDFQYLLNADIYAGEDGDYLQSRRGSQYLKKSSGAAKYSSTGINSKITWDVGTEEYLITQQGTGMYSQALITTDNPTAIALATGGAFALGSSNQADLFISGDQLYVMHPSGNYVIRWTGSVFVAYPMGLAYPWIAEVTSANAGVITGSYTLGIEKVYQVSGVDLMASTPNRRIPTTRILAVTGTISLKKIKFTIQATDLDNDSLWTHLRVWRSKNKNVDITDPLNPIDAQGNDDELYEEALITKAEIGAGSLTAIATGSTLPLGNAGTTAGKPAGVYTIELNNADSVLFNLVGIDRIELLPIPACTMGCFCANRIFFAGVQDSSLGDASKSNIWYSNYAGTKYSFQYNPLNFVDTGRDGQNMIKLIAFEKDVIGLKESKTGRLPSGNVDLPYQSLDGQIGIRFKNLAEYIPSLGIVAITSDYGDVRILGYDLRWTGQVWGRDISKPIRVYTAGFTTNLALNTSIAYINGRLILSAGLTAIVLHVHEKRGWSQYQWGNSQRILLFTFSNGARAALVSKSSHLIEVEVSGLNTDVSADDDSTAAFSVAVRPRAFRSNAGRDILEHEYLSVLGTFPSGNVQALVYANNLSWPDSGDESTPYYFTPNASIAGSDTQLATREYRLYIQPSTIGSFKWAPFVGNRLGYLISSASPLKITSISLLATIDENGIGWGAFDPHQTFPTTNTDPTWAQ